MDISRINLPRTVVQSEELINAVDEILPKYYLSITDQLDLNELMINDEPKKMQLEKVFMCEIDSGLWDKGLMTALSDITIKTVPNFLVIQSLINYTLNVYSTTDLSGVSNVFSRLVMYFPPVSAQSKEYYQNILYDNYLQLNSKKPEELNLFWCLIDDLLTCTENGKLLSDLDYVELTSLTQSISERVQQLSSCLLDNLNEKIDLRRKDKDKSIIFFDELPTKEKVKRCLTCLNFVYEILEAEFVHWFKAKELKIVPFDKSNQLFITSLVWDDVRDVGLLNSSVKKILMLQQNLQECEHSLSFQVVDKLMGLIAEIMRYSDALEDHTYPFLGKNSNALAREVSFYILERLKKIRQEDNKRDVCDLTIHIKPPWLRLLIMSHLLSVITGNPCAPELTSVVDILENVIDLKSSKENKIGIRRSNLKADARIVERLKKLPSVNSKLQSGATRLHVACNRDNVEEIRALLTFPVLEINTTDDDGMTALHLACYKGNVASVQELLSYWPQLGEVQRPVDTRAQGRDGFTPLMCAVVGGQAEVCKLLLEHTGSVLLEDINDDNKTPLDLSKSDEVTRVLRHYKINKKTTEHSKKKMHFEVGNVDVVIEFCYQLVQSYFAVHRTWDIYHSLKLKLVPCQIMSSLMKKSNIQFSYPRYHRDLKTNIEKLRKVTTNVKNIAEFKDFAEPLICILSLNKYP